MKERMKVLGPRSSERPGELTPSDHTRNSSATPEVCVSPNPVVRSFVAAPDWKRRRLCSPGDGHRAGGQGGPPYRAHFRSRTRCS